MEYRQLGKTPLKVSIIGFGNSLSTDNPNLTSELNKTLIKRAWELGINFFDTAEGYGNG
jgi:aryl-alcohol dehydrogenase-like predicted oxidoreductase